jgi:hypothetical protein
MTQFICRLSCKDALLTLDECVAVVGELLGALVLLGVQHADTEVVVDRDGHLGSGRKAGIRLVLSITTPLAVEVSRLTMVVGS